MFGNNGEARLLKGSDSIKSVLMGAGLIKSVLMGSGSSTENVLQTQTRSTEAERGVCEWFASGLRVVCKWFASGLRVVRKLSAL